MFGDNESEECPVMVSPIGEMGLGEVSTVSIASSGRLLVLGTDSGAVVQMHLQHVITDEEEHNASIAMERHAISFAVCIGTVSGAALDPVINLKSEAIDIPHYPAPHVPKLVSVDDPAVGTSYITLKRGLNSKVLASSYASTPKMFNTRLRVPATRK